MNSTPLGLSLSTSSARTAWPQVVCLALGLFLIADSVYLVARSVFNFGVWVPLALGVTFAALGWRWAAVQRWLHGNPNRRRLWRLAWAAFVLWLLTVAAFWTVLARINTDAAAGPPPATIIVLGSGTPGGKASPVLKARLERALQQAQRYPQAVVVVSGGVDFGETVSEAQIMGDYLRGRGLAASRILQEGRSTSTEENLRFTQRLLLDRGIPAAGPIQLVTSDFHTLRAGWIARRAGYSQVTLAGAPTPLYVRYNAWLREYFAALLGLALREFG